jgi:hypothetical protein
MGLQKSEYLERSPEFRAYADELIGLSEGLITQLKREEAHLMELQSQDASHADALERFKGRNAGLGLGEDTPGNEIALSQQIALMNSILIEIASIQTEQKVVQQRVLTDQKEARNLIMKMKQLEIDAQRESIRNIDQLSGGRWRETRRSALDGSSSECEPSLPKKEAGLINQLLPLSYARQS